MKLTRAALKVKKMTVLQQQKQESIKTEGNNNNAESDEKTEKLHEGENACDTGRALIVNFLED